jgi:hypothetical protein
VTAGRLSAETREHIRRLVDQAPPLTADQRTRLAVLLRPAATTEAAAGKRKAA